MSNIRYKTEKLNDYDEQRKQPLHPSSITELTSPAGGGGVLPYMGYIGRCRCDGYGFSSSLLYDRVYISEHLGLEQGIIFQETDQLVEDFIQTRDCGIRFFFGQTVSVTSVVSGEQLLQDRGDLGILLQYRAAKFS